jgi:malonyl-CoA O-methyltransferase
LPAGVKETHFPEKRAVRRRFGRSASTYDAHAVLHREVGARLLQHLDPMRIEPRLVVDLGCGTGALFEPLSRRFPRARLVGIDLAHAMLVRSRRRGRWWQRAFASPRVWLACADAERLPMAAESCDMVVSNLALQWCRPEPFFAECARVLPAEGLLLFSTFGPDTLKELRASFAVVDGAPHVGTFVDMHDLGDALVHAGFADPVMEMEIITLEYASVEAIARDLKAVGAANASPGRSRGLLGRDGWKLMAERYESFRRAGALPATYEVVYGHAWKARRRAAADGRQVIDFHPRAVR